MIREKPRGVVHFAAESHVDRSFSGPLAFVETNITGTCRLLMACRAYWEQQGKPADFRFVHVSTYQPSSPYSASKAASDHLVPAWHHTYGFPAMVTNCSYNYGPF